MKSFAELLRPGYAYARELLEECDHFPPFVIVLDVTGAQRVIVAEDGLLETVQNEVSEISRRQGLEVVAVFAEAEIEAEGRTIQRVIRAHVQARGGLNKIVLTPFVNEKGALKIGKPSIEDAESPIVDGL